MAVFSAAGNLGLPVAHVSIGDCAFASKPMFLTTVLGSCVSVTFYHRAHGKGGMFHAMLPDKGQRRCCARTTDGTFADLAVRAMVQRFRAAGMPPEELEVKVFGGANTLQNAYGADIRDMLDVGRKNVESALATLLLFGLRPVAQDVLGEHGRKLYFATGTGEVWLTYLDQNLARRYLTANARRKAQQR
ncbi:MAG: chemotaxis protein CheD [Humidesulfovibrio sp.]|nr:chemotaxis protein CheD [Humidesulfovibrio sp.]